MVGEHGTTVGVDVAAQLRAHAGAVEDVVAQDQRRGIVANVVCAEHEGLRQAVGLVLDGVGDVHAQLAAITEQAVERRRVVRRGDHQNVGDACLS